MSMFGSLSHKIAHASTIPSLGNQDLRALQDLITREKEVVASIQRLSGELARANEALKVWGQGEGLDLDDTLAQSTGALNYVVSALNGFAAHEQNIRAHMKEIRTREENLDDLRRRKKNVMVKAEAAEKKLNKMGSENKYLIQQTNMLAQLTDEMRQLDAEILSEEARIGDFKRRVTKQFMLLKFGGLLEFAEKATIVGELGKLIINEIPLDTTAPGQPRVPYHGYEKTLQMATEISRCINEVRFVADPDHSAIAALKGNSNDNVSELSELVPPPPFSTILEPEIGVEIANPPSPSSPMRATFGGTFSSLGRSSSPDRPRDPPLSLPVGSRDPYQGDSQRAAFTDPPNLFLPEIGGPSFSASLGIAPPPNEGKQSIEGLPTSSTRKTPANNNGPLDRAFMNIPSEFGGRPPPITENRTVSSFTPPPGPPPPVSRPQYNTLPLSRPSEERALAPLVTGTPPPPAPALQTPLTAKPSAPSTPAQQSAPQGSFARIIDPPGTRSAAGRFAAFPLTSRRTITTQPPEGNPSTDAPLQSRSAVVVPTTTDTSDNVITKAGGMPSKSESPRPSVEEKGTPLAPDNTKPRFRRDDSARVRFAATPPITPATPAFTKESDGTPDNDFGVHQVDDSATEELFYEQGRRLENKDRPVAVAAGLGPLGDTSKPNSGLKISPLRKKPSFEPPEPVGPVDDMSEAELNAMIDAMAAQVSQGRSPSSTLSPASQFSPASGSPSSVLATPIGSRIGSATYPNRTLGSSSPTGGDPSLIISGRISAAAFKRPASKIPGLPSNPRFTGEDTTSKLSMAPSVHSRALSSSEPRRSAEEVGQAFPQHTDTPPAQNIHANQTPSPPPEVTPVQPAEHLSRERPSPPPFPTPPEITANTFESSRLPPASTTTHYSQTNLSPPSPPPPFPSLVPPAPQTPETGFQIIATPEYYEDELSLKPRFKPMDDTSTVPPPTSLQATDSLRNYGALVPQEGTQSVDVPLPHGAGPARRPGDVVLPDSLLPGGGRGSPAPPMSPERGHSRPSSGSFNNVPLSLRPGTPRSGSPAQQDFTGVGSLAHVNREGSTRLNNAPPSVGPPSLMPLELYSPTLDFGDFGGIKGYGPAGQLQRAPSNAGHGESRFMTNLEGEYQQEKRADPKRSNGGWR